MKYTREGKALISMTCQETTANCHTLQLTVEDTGPGMHRETLEKLFHPFCQEEDGSTSPSGGTGLGLPIIKELVGLMGGTIQVDSALGRGTRAEATFVMGKVQDYQ